ncbi:MAG: hypothetical protein V3V99_10805 [candidate division Zixibacteria bacterium]
MSKGKPKGPTPSLISGTNGTPKRASVKRKSACKRCKTTLEKGTTCIDIPQSGRGVSSKKRYCNDCFKNILEKTKSDLEELSSL